LLLRKTKTSEQIALFYLKNDTSSVDLKVHNSHIFSTKLSFSFQGKFFFQTAAQKSRSLFISPNQSLSVDYREEEVRMADLVLRSNFSFSDNESLEFTFLTTSPSKNHEYLIWLNLISICC